jgi:hypothetical protein
MSHKITGTDKTALLCVIAILAATISGCTSPPQSLSRKDSRPAAAAAPSPSPTATPDRYKIGGDRGQAFYKRKEEFIKLPAKVQLTPEPYLKGKAAFYHYHVEPEKPKPDWWLVNNLDGHTHTFSYENVIRDVTALMPDEVETVVLWKCQQVRKGSYVVRDTGRSIPAYVWSSDLTIVDRTIPAVVYRKKFEGELYSIFGVESPILISADQDKVVSSSPDKAIYTFLGGLPRR